VRVDFQRPFTAPEGAQDVILVRHGSIDAYPPGEHGTLTDGHSDPPLSDSGRLQAEELAARLAGFPIAALFVSTLRRTVETAAPLSARAGLAPVVLPDLREVYLGEWEGGVIADRAARGDAEFQRVMREELWELIPGAERRSAFISRVMAGLDAVAAAAQPGQVAVAVTHSGVVAEICAQITGSRPFAFLNVTNTSLTRLVRMPNGRWMLVAFNDTAHLGNGGSAA
jgi:probable phosphoglycerate mutase